MESTDGDKILTYLRSPTLEMLEQGSLASDYDLSQDRIAEVWRVMVQTLLYRVDHPDE